MERGGKRRHSQWADLGGLSDGCWSLYLLIHLIRVWKPRALSGSVELGPYFRLSGFLDKMGSFADGVVAI